MNLTKLFNFNYLKENLKKSKGFILLLSLIVPVFTFLVIILSFNNREIITVIDKPYLMVINLIGMYVIPVLISYVLFGFVFKKTSVDFVVSQPINRKTLFVTNTIGGILLITVIQLITAFAILLCGAFLPNIIIFSQMVFDIFIIMWLGYVFVFVATNIAMTLSGTFLTQIVLTMLILFLVPFCNDYFFRFGTSNFDKIDNIEQNVYISAGEDYTLPYQIVSYFTNGIFFYYDDTEFLTNSANGKMLVLSLIYIAVGLFLFQRRKMENNEESFFYAKAHLFVKALTMLPMIMVLNLIHSDKETTIFLLALIITYYFVYDFIVKRKIKFFTSVLYLILILAILQGSTYALEKMQKSYFDKPLNSDDFVAVKIVGYSSSKFERSRSFKVDSVNNYIDNKDVIKLIFDSAEKYYNGKGKDYTYDDDTYIENKYMVSESYESTVTESIDEIEENEDIAYLNIKIKDNKNNKYNCSLNMYEKDFNEIINMLEKDENYFANIKKSITHDSYMTLSNFKILEDKEKEVIDNEINNYVKNASLNDLFNIRNSEGARIIKYFYEDGILQSVIIKDDLTNTILDIVSKYSNELFKEKIKEKEDKYFNVGVIREDGTHFYFSYNKSENSIYNLVINDNDGFDYTKPYYILNSYIDGDLYYYTNKVEEINELIKDEEEKNKNDYKYYDDTVDYTIEEGVVQ